jgi:hypothetical protein
MPPIATTAKEIAIISTLMPGVTEIKRRYTCSPKGSKNAPYYKGTGEYLADLGTHGLADLPVKYNGLYQSSVTREA